MQGRFPDQRWLVAARGRFARDVGTTVFASFLVLATSGAQSVLIAHEFGPHGKGLITLTLLLPGVLSPLLSSGFNASATYFASRFPIQVSFQHQLTFSAVASLVGLFVGVVLNALGLIHDVASDLTGAYLVLAVVALPVLILHAGTGSLLMGLGQISVVNFIRIGLNGLSLAAVALLVTLDGSPQQVVAVTVGLTSLAAALQLSRLARLAGPGAVRFGWNRESARPQLAYAVKDHLGAVLQFLNYRLDQVILTAYLGTTQLGLYSVSVTLGEVLWVIPDGLGNVVFQRSAASRGETARRKALTAYGLGLAATLGGAVLLAIFGRVLVEVLFSEAFLPSYGALIWLLPGAVVLGPTKILINDLAGRGYPLVHSVCAAAGLVATVAFDIWLIPAYGIRGAAAASSASYVIISVLAVLAYSRLPGSSGAGNEVAC